MFEDPIVEETRRHREAYAASFGYDLKKIVADLQSRQGKDGRQIVDRRKKSAPNVVLEPPITGVPDTSPSVGTGQSR